jgi:DNA invertase Pin-like site-specific DNA recombinase
MATIGYCRVSTGDQDLALQRDALNAAGCTRLYQDVISGKTTERPGLAKCLDRLEPGDTLVVWRLDRLGRNMPHLIETITALTDRGIGFRSLDGLTADSSATGRLVTGMLALLAEFERNLISERTKAGLAAARARGRKGGRKPSLTPEQVDTARKMYAARTMTVAQIAATLDVSKATIERAVRVR